MKSAPVLRTTRLLLKGISEEDTGFIVELRSNPDVFKYFVFPHMVIKEEHIQWYRNNYLINENRIDWIAQASSGVPVGVFGVKREKEDNEEAEVSYILSPVEYGHGYASEAINRIIEFCRDEWKCAYVIAEIHEQNTNSTRFAEKLGFKREEKKGVFLRYKRKV